MAMTKHEVLQLKRAAIFLAEIAGTLSDATCKMETLMMAKAVIKAVHEIENKKPEGENDNGRPKINGFPEKS